MILNHFNMKKARKHQKESKMSGFISVMLLFIHAFIELLFLTNLQIEMTRNVWALAGKYLTNVDEDIKQLCRSFSHVSTVNAYDNAENSKVTFPANFISICRYMELFCSKRSCYQCTRDSGCKFI